jgi:hypothetical protein
MHANAIALSALLLGAGLLGASSAQAVMTPDQGSIVGPAPASSEPPAAALIQLAEGHKGGDKYVRQGRRPAWRRRDRRRQEGRQIGE